ncbi:unnamed protein product, partial [Tetraodon nigroviridis]
MEIPAAGERVFAVESIEKRRTGRGGSSTWSSGEDGLPGKSSSVRAGAPSTWRALLWRLCARTVRSARRNDSVAKVGGADAWARGQGTYVDVLQSGARDTHTHARTHTAVRKSYSGFLTRAPTGSARVYGRVARAVPSAHLSSLSRYNTWEPEENILDPGCWTPSGRETPPLRLGPSAPALTGLFLVGWSSASMNRHKRLASSSYSRLWEHQEQLKRGPKAKHLLIRVPSFARRSSVLAELREVSLEEGRCQAAKPVDMQYQLTSSKHQQYSPVRRERDGRGRSTGKPGYYQLNSKQQRPYQPGLEVQGPLRAEAQDAEAPQPPANGYRLPPVLQQKWVRDKDSGCLTKVKDITTELQKLPADLSGPKGGRKVGCAEGGPPRAEGLRSRKLKIVKNKNKNGRIVIVMSKFMEGGTHPANRRTGKLR